MRLHFTKYGKIRIHIKFFKILIDLLHVVYSAFWKKKRVTVFGKQTCTPINIISLNKNKFKDNKSSSHIHNL